MSDFFWIKRGEWPEEAFGYVFLGQAVVEIGAAMFGSDWTGYEGATPAPLDIPSDPTFKLPDGRVVTLRPSLNMKWQHAASVGAMLKKHRDWKEPSGPISRWKFQPQEWADGIALAKAENEDRNARRLRFASVVAATRRAALAGDLVTALRPVAGGMPGDPLPSHLWNTESVKPRFHFCQMSPSDPFGNGLAGPRHQYIFVSRESLDKFIAKIAPTPEPEMQRKAWQKWFRELVASTPPRSMPAKAIEKYAWENFGVARTKVEEDRAEILKEFPEETMLAWTRGGRGKGARRNPA